MKPTIEVRDNQVMIEGHLMTRPRRITREEWTGFWDRAKGDPRIEHDAAYTEGHEMGSRDTDERSYEEGYDQGYQAGLISRDQP